METEILPMMMRSEVIEITFILSFFFTQISFLQRTQVCFIILTDGVFLEHDFSIISLQIIYNKNDETICNNNAATWYHSYYVCDVNALYSFMTWSALLLYTRIDRMNKSGQFVFSFDIIRIFFENLILS